MLLILLTACVPPPEEYARKRMKLAQAEDALAECRLFALEEGFKETNQECTKFLVIDRECAKFPEKKSACIQHTRAADYLENKLLCQKFSRKERKCAKEVETKIPNWFYNTARYIGLDWKKKTWIEWVLAAAPEIHIGVVLSGIGKGNFINGVRLAVEEINQDQGILGRKLVIHEYLTKGQLYYSRKAADRFKKDIRIRVVIGRQSSSSTIPVTYQYEKSGIVYLAASATNKGVIRYGMRNIFRQLPNNDEFATALGKFATQQNYHNISILHSRDAYSEELAYAFRDYAINNKLEILYEKSFFSTQETFYDIAADMRELKLDAIFIATGYKTAVNLIKGLRSMGIKEPRLIGCDSMDSAVFAHSIGEDGNGIVVPTIYSPFSKHPENTNFVKAYRNEYGHAPDTWSAQGYDAIKLLGYIMDQKAQSTVPANISMGLRYMEPRTGATGKYQYHNSGEILNKPIFFKELQHEEFILFKDTKQEEEQSQRIEIVDDRIILRPLKPSESTEAMSILE